MKLARSFWRLGVMLLLGAAAARAASVQGCLIFSSTGSPAPYVGGFYLTNVPPGKYDLEVWRNGKKSITIEIMIREPATQLGAINVR